MDIIDYWLLIILVTGDREISFSLLFIISSHSWLIFYLFLTLAVTNMSHILQNIIPGQIIERKVNTPKWPCEELKHSAYLCLHSHHLSLQIISLCIVPNPVFSGFIYDCNSIVCSLIRLRSFSWQLGRKSLCVFCVWNLFSFCLMW